MSNRLLTCLPYSGKLSREKTFANWWKIWFSQWKLSQIVRFCHTKECHAPKFHEKPQKLQNLWKFLPQKFPPSVWYYMKNNFFPVSFQSYTANDIVYTKIATHVHISLYKTIYITLIWRATLAPVRKGGILLYGHRATALQSLWWYSALFTYTRTMPCIVWS